MKRALLVSTGTLAGLAAVLTYSSGETPIALASDVPAGNVAGLGGPAAEAPTDDASASPSASPSPSKAAPKPTASKAAKPKPAKSTAAAPAPAKAAPTATKAPVAKPTPTPTKTKAAPPPKPSGDFLGTAVAYKYGTLQMGIRVKNGKIVDAWAVKYPKGDSQPYSEMAIPILRQQTIGATSSRIAGATGASLTSNAWAKSLAGAIAKSGI